MIPTIEWHGNRIRMIDQRKLPGKVEWFVCRGYKDVIRAIQTMVIRGAPAIGVAAAMGLAMGASSIRTGSYGAFRARFKEMAAEDGQGQAHGRESEMGRGKDVLPGGENGRP